MCSSEIADNKMTTITPTILYTLFLINAKNNELAKAT